MTPLRNGSDYYKKMLELQERLRRSEEERIRLEERFSLLEHESRSRHETCINRLRMRYIEFLEEQQTRDERNHRLLGALDRVDSSLALMSAKTDRLGALRKQYETSALSSYNNRMNGSMTGDSGVVSQNDEKQRRRSNVIGGNKHFFADRGAVAFGHDKNISRSTQRSFSQVRSDPRYSNWSGARYEKSQMINSSIGLARFSQNGTASLASKNSVPTCINSVNPRILLDTRSCIDRIAIPQSSPAYEYRLNSSRFAAPEYPLRKTDAKNYSSDWRDPPTNGIVMRDLANSGAYDSYTVPSRSFNDSSGYSRGSFQPEQHVAAAVSNLTSVDPGKRLQGYSNYSGSSKDRLIPASQQAPHTKVTDILRQELGDEEEYIGSIVENELERYISKIRNLHREADPQSGEELDHEQNTSGDLLNVTLSDDGVDLSVEDKSRPRALPQHLGNVLELANDLANRTATCANNVANDYRTEIVDKSRAAGLTGTGADEGLRAGNPYSRRDEKDSPCASNAVNQLTSVNPILGTTGRYDDAAPEASNEKFPLLAKNGISAEVAKARSELATRPRTNIEDVAKSTRNSQEIRAGIVESNEVDNNARYGARSTLFEKEHNQDIRDDRSNELIHDAAGLKKLDDAYKVFNGEERETEDYLRDIAEELEPWNLNALERRVQEIILNDEAQADYVRRESDGADLSIPKQTEPTISDLRAMNNGDVDNCITGAETDEPSEGCENRTSPIGERAKSLSGVINDDDSSPKVKQFEKSSPSIADQSINQLTEESPEKQNLREAPDCLDAVGNVVDPSIDYGVTEVGKNYINEEDGSLARTEYPQESNTGYQYSENEQYQRDPNEQYQNYDPNNVQYEQDSNGQYPYVDQQYRPAYTEDPNAQQPYEQDPNATYLEDSGQRYVADNDREYAADPNQQYATDPSYGQYLVDPNQEYATNVDPNQEYSTNVDPNQEYSTNVDPNQEYSTNVDPNQEYSTNVDPNQEYSMNVDPNQEYSTNVDPNQEYSTNVDPNQEYSTNVDPNQEYSTNVDPNQAYSTNVDPNQEYSTNVDPNQEYSTNVNPNQEYSTNVNPNQEYSTNVDPNQAYSTNVDPSQEYSTNVDQQQYQQGEDYGQDDSRAYGASDTDYIYPEGQQYADTAIYEPNGQLAPDGGQGYIDGQMESVDYESQNKFKEDPSKGSDDDRRSNEINESADTHDQTKISQKEESKPAKKSKDVIKSLLDSDTESTIERNVSNTESDFDFN